MHTRLGWLGLVGVGMLGVGCGTSSVPIDSVGDEFVATVCEEIRRCPQLWGSEIGLISNLYEQGAADASCEDLLANISTLSRAPQEVAGVEAGTIAYDGAQARRCVRALIDGCIPFQFIDQVEECDGVFTGTLGLGESCDADSECAPSTHCALTSPCNGTCTAQLPAGEACIADSQCLSGSCEFDGLGATCVDYTLVRGAGLGEACGDVDDEGPTRIGAVCAPGLYCRATVSGGVCAEPVAAGDDCESDDVCALGFFCEGGQCRTATFADSVGDTCGGDTYILCDATLGLACDTDTDRCVAVGDGTVGSPCTYGNDEFFSLFACDDGLYCDTEADEPVCSARRNVGAPCDSDGQCETGYCVGGECSEPTLCEPFIF